MQNFTPVVVCAFVVICGILFLGAYKTSSADYVYTFELAEWEFPGEEVVFYDLPAGLRKVKDYLKSQRCLINDFYYLYYKGNDDEAADRQAKAVFNQLVSNLSKAEIDALDLPAGSKFTYRVSRNCVIIGEYAYP